MASDDSKYLTDQAVLALRGLIDGREKALANLLRSDVALAPTIRGMLADALEGKSGLIALSTDGASKMKQPKAVRRWKQVIVLGRRAEAFMAANGYKSTAEFGKLEGRGDKSVEADVTFTRKARRWAQDRATVLGIIADPEQSRLAQPDIMDTLFAMAAADMGGKARQKANEAEMFNKASELFAQVVDETERAQKRWQDRSAGPGHTSP